MSDSLRPHGPQHARPPCPSSCPGVYSNSCLFILCHPLLLLPPIPLSIRVFSDESTLRMRWPKYWSFTFSISPSNEHPGLISFRMDWLDLLAVQGTLKSLLQHHSSKASILQHSAFFIQVNYNLIVNISAVVGTFPFLWNVYFRLLWWSHFWTQHCSLNLPLHILHSCNNVHLLDTSADLLPAGSTTNVVTCVHKTWFIIF